MTPAIRLLKSKHIAFNVHQYKHQADMSHFGREAITELSKMMDIVPAQVFKTLIVSLNGDDHQLMTAVTPVEYQLDLKAVAKIMDSKSALSPVK